MRLSPVLRRLVGLPVFTAIAVATLAIGIGANAAIFSVIEGVLLKPLPYPAAEELVAIDHRAPGVNLERAGSAPFLYFTYREDARTLQNLGLWVSDTVSVTGLDRPEEVITLHVTDGVLPALQVQAALGRIFSAHDDLPGSAETVVLTSGFWRSKFGGDRTAIGRRLLLDGRPREIIGVLPETFSFLDVKAAVLLPLRLDRSKTHLGNFSYNAVGRMKPGVTVAQVNADMGRLIPLALQRFPPFPGFSVKMFEDARLGPAARPLKEHVIGDVSTVLWVLMGTIGMVLLIACANVANLLLVRAEARQQELAIRAALGASRRQIARELLLESIVLGLIGGAFGLALAYGALQWLLATAPGNLPRLDQIAIDGPVLLFTLVVAVAAGLLFGVIPVIRYAGPRINTALRTGGRTMSHSKERHRARNTLVIVQVALALVLLISSGLMIRTFQAMKGVNPGFVRPQEVLTLRLTIPQSVVPDDTMAVRTEQAIMERLAAVPGVVSVGLSTIVPMTGDGWHDPIFVENHVYTESQIPPLRTYKFISPGLLKTMGNTVAAGREFTWTDVYEKRPVAMVSENLARELWGEPSAALGKRIRENLKAGWREVIGVVSDERDDGVNQKAPAIALWPLQMADFAGEAVFVRRSLAYMIRSPRTGSHGFVDDISRAVWSVNPNLPLASVRTLQEVYDTSLARTSFTLVMLAVAGAMALLLGVAGIYGVMSYAVSQRTREIGVRMALGARKTEVLRLFVGQGITLAAVGVGCGLVAAFGVMRLLSSLLFDVSPVDPATYAAVSLSLMAAAAIASYLPALRATTVNPMNALRAE
jgi:putative ABC transport system permease protein